MKRFFAAAALALALSALDIAHACDITTNPVSQDEVEAAGLGPLLRQADQQLGEDTHALMDTIKTKAQADAAADDFKRIKDAYHNRMVIPAKRARCGTAD
jgi:hypothetical protein